MTDAGSHHTAGLESDMDEQHTKIDADFGDGAAHEKVTLQPAPQPESRTLLVTIDSTRPKKLVPQTAQPKVKTYKQTHKPRVNKRIRISFTVGETAVSMVSESAQPETINNKELVMFNLRLHHTPTPCAAHLFVKQPVLENF